jgi:hypothetical protein
VTDVGSNATPTYKLALLPFLPAGFNIDHVISDTLHGACWAAGITPGRPAVTDMTYFDHTAIVCDVTE